MPLHAGLLELGPVNAELTVHTTRDGLAAAVGHDLTLEVTRWSATVDLAEGLQAAEVTAAGDLPAGGGALNHAVMTGELTVHGTTRPVTVELRRDGDAYVGRATIRQTEFGIKPFSAMLGPLRISDEVNVTVRARLGR